MGPVEVATLEEKGLGTRLRERIDRTIGDFQLGRITLSGSDDRGHIQNHQGGNPQPS